LAKSLKQKIIPVGEYGKNSIFEKLKKSLRRGLTFAKKFENEPPDIAIAHQSVELCRVAFGLRIPIILTADTPHANAVNRLTIPLANTLVISEAIPKRLYKKFGAKEIIQFKGVDEVAWIKNFKPKSHKLDRPLIVVRQMETKASYAIGKKDVTEKVANKLTALGNVVFLSRYKKQEKDKMILKQNFVDSASLVANADLVVSVGGTIAREAALQGTPTIVLSEFGKIHVNRYLSDKGFPLFIIDKSKVISTATKNLGNKWNVKEKLEEMENPTEIIGEIVGKKIKP
jgi:predicted glycosyltransferase